MSEKKKIKKTNAKPGKKPGSFFSGGDGTFDWDAVKAEYITSNISYKDLTTKYGMPMSTLTSHIKADGNSWVPARKKYRSSIVAKAIWKKTEKEAEKLSALMSAADGMAALIGKVVSDADGFYKYILSDGQGGATEKQFTKADTKAIKDMTGAISSLTDTLRNLYGLPTAAEVINMELAEKKIEIDREKLALDKKRTEYENAKDSGATDVHIVIGGGDGFVG